MSLSRRLHLEHRARVALMGTLTLFVALVATAFAIGGSGSKGVGGSGTSSSGVAYGAPGLPVAAPTSAPLHGTSQRFSAIGGGGAAAEVATAPKAVPAPPSTEAFGSSQGSGSAAGGTVTQSGTATASDASDSSVEATKIVKTGYLTLQVDKSKVDSVVGQLTSLAGAQGGYVSSSTTNTGSGEPSGEVVLRIPVDHFTDAVSTAETYGHELSLNTSADDVTGHYVDLTARLTALQRTRAVYLTILGRATTIGATLAVQERIQGVQQQIDQLTGQLKVLNNQTSYSTLTVDVTPQALVAAVSQERKGLSKAWHDSWSRFGRGIDGIVGAIGPIVLALLILAAAAGIGLVGYRGVRRVTS
jgi:hypothetical protein